MKVLLSIKYLLVLAWVLTLGADATFAEFIDFEDGVDNMVIANSIPGLEFTNTAGYDWVYGDWRTNGYNGSYPNYSIVNDWLWPRPLETQYYSDGNFFGWLGAEQGKGVITFTQSYVTYFKIGYSTASGVTLEAYDSDDNLLDMDIGVENNMGTGYLDYLRVDAPGMAYVTMYGMNNQWLADNLETDAIQDCTEDSHCNDGVYCNGEETCNLQLYQCEDGDLVLCEDDGLFCNGEEFCSEAEEECVHSGDPCEDDGEFCNGDESCDEDAAQCLHTGGPCQEGYACDEAQDECLPFNVHDDDDEADDDDFTIGDDDTDSDDAGDDDDFTVGDDDTDGDDAGDDEEEQGGGDEDDGGGCCG